MWKQFKEFAFKGNVVDMAVGVIIGGAFCKIVTSLVNDVIMPFFGFLTAGADFSSLKLVLSQAVVENGVEIKPEAAIAYGSFLQNVVDFLIIALCIFFFVKLANKLRTRNEPPKEPEKSKGPTSEELLAEIRDLLKAEE